MQDYLKYNNLEFIDARTFKSDHGTVKRLLIKYLQFHQYWLQFDRLLHPFFAKVQGVNLSLELRNLLYLT